ncbi:glycoside hydrolase family 65 central catalytic [Thermoanaerobacter mathranii subsp. mathranii str. A3]|uniref:Glycoside hydrolase family 65 central catalytic n=1 Tax=Thermoanaerobacter mathranii subsp. mathranii (strain DSM 11426 / CCUG 53645 / CIP 108742 / A3) TaxID=583358 RepID=A0ABM5LP56_THEM3|nr:glycoside hydrolase family 65 protein [Thermoanaerobacter mathranii]ADH60543.1 glycoside hydrolase family 65 central catalytic [Thermoanaerobacter mathranii subsp. mathranii str. A3]
MANKTKKPIYPFEDWVIRETQFSIDTNYRNETIFALANGYIGMRGTFEEGYSGPKNTSFNGTYINGFYEIHDITYPEGGYGFAKIGQTMLNVADSKIIKLYVDGEEFDLLQGKILFYERVLDMKKGFVERKVKWESPTGKVLEVRIKRIVSLARQHLAAISFTVEPVNFTGKIRFVSAIDGNVSNINDSEDVRVGSNLKGKVLKTIDKGVEDLKGWIVQKTQKSNFSYVCAIDNALVGDSKYEVSNSLEEDGVKVIIDVEAEKGNSYTLNKFISYYTSKDFDENKLVALALEEIEKAKNDGFETIEKEQEEFLNSFWEDADVIIEGDKALQQGIRFNEFHLLQSVGRDGKTNIAAKGLTGEGYEGHYFWDSDIYIMPFFLYTKPEIAKALVMYRYNLLDAARSRAKELGYKGALYPWRTIDGPECSAYFPAGTAQYHINADIVYALKRYVEATNDLDFLYDYGCEILFETARFWKDLGAYIPLKDNKFCINCVTGPDEYTALVDNNAYTNYMAKMNLEYAYNIANKMKKEVPHKYQKVASKLNLKDEEIAAWKKAADKMYLPYSKELDIIPQDDSFLYKERLTVDEIPQDQFPLLLHWHYLNIYRYQICKQPDVLLLMFLQREKFTKDELKKNYDYYEPITTHDSSLSPAIFSILANEIGYTDKAYKYFMMTARMDLDDYNDNVKDGIHAASMAGTWLAVVNGFGGMRVYTNELHFEPRLPKEWNLLSFNVRYKGRKINVKLTKEGVVFELLEGEPIEIYYFDEKILLEKGENKVESRKN